MHNIRKTDTAGCEVRNGDQESNETLGGDDMDGEMSEYCWEGKSSRNLMFLWKQTDESSDESLQEKTKWYYI